MNVHPVAELFPMMADDELDDLAEDIKAQGLLNPIVRKDGVLIDGRNRLEACRRADVEPTFVEMDGQEPVAYILGANVARRHLNAGQRAMAVVMAESLETKERNGRKERAARLVSVSAGRISQAAAVHEYVPEVAPAVMAGTMGLDEAYVRARARKSDMETQAERDTLAERQLAALRKSSPDLADLVAEDRLTLDDAVRIEQDREQKKADERRRATAIFTGALVQLVNVRNQTPQEFIANYQREHNPMLIAPQNEVAFTPDGLLAGARWLEELARELKKGRTSLL